MKTLLLVLFATIFTFSVFAQSTANSSATVTASLVKGLSISKVGGNLDFPTVVLTGVAQAPSILPQNGVSFKVIGHPSKNITVTFGTVNLTNDAWVTSIGGGTNSSIQFTPSVTQTGSSSLYSGSSAVTSGNLIPLVNVSGEGNMYVWVGGSLDIASDQAQGDYTGTFTLSVAY